MKPTPHFMPVKPHPPNEQRDEAPVKRRSGEGYRKVPPLRLRTCSSNTAKGPAGSRTANRHEPPGSGDLDQPTWRSVMNSVIYLVGLVVVVLAILSFLGLR